MYRLNEHLFKFVSSTYILYKFFLFSFVYTLYIYYLDLFRNFCNFHFVEISTKIPSLAIFYANKKTSVTLCVKSYIITLSQSCEFPTFVSSAAREGI